MKTSSKLKVKSKKSGLQLLALYLLLILVNSCHSGIQKTIPTATSNQSGIAKFAFSEEIHNFGPIKAGEIVSFTFIFKNEGTKSLTVTGIDSGCGCTRVNMPDKTIAPGAEGQIEVIYDSSGEIGKQLKTITIFSNADQAQKQLYIKANVTNELIEINS